MISDVLPLSLLYDWEMEFDSVVSRSDQKGG